MNWVMTVSRREVRNEPIREVPRRQRRTRAFVKISYPGRGREADKISKIYGYQVCQSCGQTKVFDAASMDSVCPVGHKQTAVEPQVTFVLDNWLSKFWR